MARDFRYRDGLAVAQVVVFTFFLFLGVVIGLQKKIGWFGLITISIIRLVGASCMLATIHNSSDGVWAAVFVCESLGLVILTYLLLGQLTRVNMHLQVLTKWHFRVPDLICWAGIGVTIAEFVQYTRQDNGLAPNALTQAGFGLFVGVYGWAIFLFALLAWRWKDLPRAQWRPMICFAATIPFMVVRIAYSLTYVATGDERFSAVVGDPTIYLIMTMMNEMVIIGVVSWSTLSMARMTSKPEASKAGNRGSETELPLSNGRPET